MRTWRVERLWPLFIWLRCLILPSICKTRSRDCGSTFVQLPVRIGHLEMGVKLMYEDSDTSDSWLSECYNCLHPRILWVVRPEAPVTSSCTGHWHITRARSREKYFFLSLSSICSSNVSQPSHAILSIPNTSRSMMRQNLFVLLTLSQFLFLASVI